MARGTHTWIAFIALLFTLGCSGNKETTEDSPTVEKSDEGTASITLIFTPQSPQLVDGENELSISPTTLELAGGEPTPWTCSEEKCEALTTLGGQALPFEAAVPRLHPDPGVTAHAFVSLAKNLLPKNSPTPFLIRVKSASGKDVAIQASLGKTIQPLADPRSMKVSILRQGGSKKGSAAKAGSQAPTGPKISIRGGAITLPEECQDRTLGRKTRREIRKYSTCYREYAAEGTPQQGDVSLTWKVTPAGKAVNVNLESAALTDTTLLACVQRVLEQTEYVQDPERSPNCTLAWSLKYALRKQEPKVDTPAPETKGPGRVQITVGKSTLSISGGTNAELTIVQHTDTKKALETLTTYTKANSTALLLYKPGLGVEPYVQALALAHEAGFETVLMGHPRRP